MDILYHTDEVLDLRPRYWRLFLLSGVLFLTMGFVTFLLFGQVAVLECTRTQISKPSCVLSHTLVGFTFKEQAVPGLNRARINESIDSDDDATYKIFLETDNGDIPLTFYYSSGKSEKQAAVTEINTYLVDREEQILDVQYRFGNGLMPLISIILSVPSIVIGLMVKGTVWHMSKTERVITHYRKGFSGTKVTEYNLDEVTGAVVTSSRDSDGDRTYRIQYTTRSGDSIPMTSWYSSGYKKKSETAALINAFLAR